MDNKSIERIISSERFRPYLRYHSGNFDYQLKRKFDDDNWFDNPEFIKIITGFQMQGIAF